VGKRLSHGSFARLPRLPRLPRLLSAVTDGTVQPSSEHAASARRSKGAVLFGLPIVEQIEGAFLGRPFEAIEAGERCLVKTGTDGEFELRLTEPKASQYN